MEQLSICILALNEEKNIQALLESVRDLGDEIIVVVDDHTTDQTSVIAKRYTDKVIVHKHEDNFHKNKQFTLDQATNDWVLWMDADEVVESELKNEIRTTLENPSCTAYRIPRKNIMFGKWIRHTGWYPDHQIRLFRKDGTSFPCQRIHEDPKVTGEIGTLQNHIIHKNYESVSHYLQKLDKYTALDASHNYSHKKPDVTDLLLNPVREFIKRFLLWEGYKDGVAGLSLSMLQAFYETVVVIKAFENDNFSEESEPMQLLHQVKQTGKKAIKEARWWVFEMKIRRTKLPVSKLILKLQRKIRLK